jgi:hypothetical protein
MLRSSFLVFITGWTVWFWIDKPDASQFRMPAAGDSMLHNFQTAFDLLKAGYVGMSFVYLWSVHYLVLSLLGGALVTVGYNIIADHLGRRRMRRHFLPPSRKQAREATAGHPDPIEKAAGQDRASR